MENIIGIGGILATIIVGIITCVVTWVVAKRSQKIMKFSWSAEITKVLNINPKVDRGKIQIFHDGTEIKNAHMIQIKIKNTGNIAIASPVIMIKVDNSDKIIFRALAISLTAMKINGNYVVSVIKSARLSSSILIQDNGLA